MGFLKPQSIQQRFFIGVTISIAFALLIYCTVRIVYEVYTVKADLEEQGSRLLDISARSLSSAMWQYNEEYVDDYIEALFQFQDIAHVTLTDDQGSSKSKTRDRFSGTQFPQHTEDTSFIVRDSPIMHNGIKIGQVSLVLSTERLRKQVIYNSITTILLMVFIVCLLFFTIYYLSRRYIFAPLSRLEASAALIAKGNLDIPIDSGADDEIGHLATTLREMIQSIKSITTSRDELNHEIMVRKSTENTLQKTVSLLQKAELIGKSGSWSLEIQTGKCEWSYGTYLLHDLSPDSPASHELHLQSVHPLDREYHDLEFQHNLDSDLTRCLQEFRTLRPDRKLRHIQSEYEIIRDDKGHAVMVQGTYRDITLYKVAEQEREMLLSAIEQAAETIVITDSEGIIQYVNPAFVKLTGYSRHEAIGNKPSITKSGRQDQEFYENLWNTISSKQIWSGHITNKSKDGNLYEEEVTISPIKDKKGDVSHYVAVKRDVTKEVDLENQLQQALKMEAIGTLTSGIAHDFNNILAAIIGYGELVQDQVAPESDIGKEVANILFASKRATDLVRQLLTFSRKVDAEKTPVSIHEIITDSVKMMRATLPSSIQIEENISDCGTVIANPINLHQIAVNLCTNAFHALDIDRGKITINLKSRELTMADLPLNLDLNPGNFAVLTIIDNGCGMEQRVVDRIFEPYFTTKEIGKGTGLGLSVVHGIVRDCKGFVEVSSKVGMGTSFHVFLPISNCSAAPDTGKIEGEKGTPIDSCAYHILVVDDEPFLVKINQRRLENSGYTVTAFTSSIEALEAFNKEPDHYDLLITDQTMPGMTGIELAQKILELRPSMPIIMCTGHSESVPKEKAMEAGIAKYVFKPLHGDELLIAVQEVLRINK